MLNSLSTTLAKISIVLLLISQAFAAETTSTIAIPFNQTPVALPEALYRACSCESWGNPNSAPRQFHDDGSVIWGNDPKTGLPIMRDVGACQINTIAHAAAIASSGLDVVNSLHDNETFALDLYKEFGMTPWAPSKSCWNGK